MFREFTDDREGDRDLQQKGEEDDEVEGGKRKACFDMGGEGEQEWEGQTCWEEGEKVEEVGDGGLHNEGPLLVCR